MKSIVSQCLKQERVQGSHSSYEKEGHINQNGFMEELDLEAFRGFNDYLWKFISFLNFVLLQQNNWAWVLYKERRLQPTVLVAQSPGKDGLIGSASGEVPLGYLKTWSKSQKGAGCIQKGTSTWGGLISQQPTVVRITWGSTKIKFFFLRAVPLMIELSPSRFCPLKISPHWGWSFQNTNLWEM